MKGSRVIDRTPSQVYTKDEENFKKATMNKGVEF